MANKVKPGGVCKAFLAAGIEIIVGNTKDGQPPDNISVAFYLPDGTLSPRFSFPVGKLDDVIEQFQKARADVQRYRSEKN